VVQGDRFLCAAGIPWALSVWREILIASTQRQADYPIGTDWLSAGAVGWASRLFGRAAAGSLKPYAADPMASPLVSLIAREAGGTSALGAHAWIQNRRASMCNISEFFQLDGKSCWAGRGCSAAFRSNDCRSNIVAAFGG